MKSISKNTTYVPNRDVKELMLVLKGELKKISGSDIIDGVYVKNKKTTSKMPQSSVSEILEKLKSIQKENEAELGIGETEIKELLNAGFNAKDIEIIYTGYSPSSVNADTEFGNTTSGFISSYADYQKKAVKSIVESASQGMYEIGLKYPDFNWKSIIDKYKIKSTPKIVTKSIGDYEYKYEVYFGNGIAIGHSIANKRRSETWQYDGSSIGELTSKPSKYQKDKSYKAGFNGGYWGIVVKSKDAVYSIVDELLKQSGSYVKDLELFENRLGGIGINEVKNEKFAKGGGVENIEVVPISDDDKLNILVKKKNYTEMSNSEKINFFDNLLKIKHNGEKYTAVGYESIGKGRTFTLEEAKENAKIFKKAYSNYDFIVKEVIGNWAEKDITKKSYVVMSNKKFSQEELSYIKPFVKFSNGGGVGSSFEYTIGGL